MRSVFSDVDWRGRADWPFLQNGHVNLFVNSLILDTAVTQLSDLDYRIAELDCSSEAAFFRSVSAALKWTEQFGYSDWNGNLDALNDAMRAETDILTDRFLLVARNFHQARDFSEDIFNTFWDIFEFQGRDALLFGQAKIGFVQVDSRSTELGSLGARRANWNNQEWLT